ncbi:cilia- and flagella-associated protein 161 [Synchiropus splendidus]|uniref:cilia- and flagella-associated protein 161 n=1 Tax=Synchiropus splendidus TaxID=270530 RepID=UPI00237D8ECB|nr:cilia- and flagella-associated protein 161 [Synchiropus splendidus]
MTERRYRISVRLGNWYEDQRLKEDADKEHQERALQGQLSCQKEDFLVENLQRPVELSPSPDGMVHFGDVVMLVNAGGESGQRSALSINATVNPFRRIPYPAIESPCGVSGGKSLQPCARTAFVITSVGGESDTGVLHFDQAFALKTASGFAGGLYLKSHLRSFQKCAKVSRLQEVNLEDAATFESWWKIVYFDPQERLEFEGLPVPANERVLVVHCKTNQALAVVENHSLWTVFGRESEVVAHTFLDSHKAERDNNHWLLKNV